METAKRRPTVLDVGKRNAKDIRNLKKGSGRLFDKVQSAVAQVQAGVPAGKDILPVVIIYRKRTRRPKKGLAMFGL